MSEKENKIKEPKAPKAPKEPKAAKKAKKQMPEGYIGRPKPMKTNKFEFKKPTTKTWVELGIFLVIAAFIAYIVVRLVNVGKVVDAFIKPYEFNEKTTPESFVLENSKLKFEMDSATTQFTVTQKDTGHVWYSNPPEVQSDPIALAKEKNNMMSTLLVKYSTENGVTNTYDTYTYSIKRNFYQISKKGNEINVDYTVSQMEREYKYPLAIYEEEMDEYLEKMSSSDKNVIQKRCYRLIDLDNLKASDNASELLRKYPGLEDDNMYLIFDPLNTYLKENCEKIFAKVDYSDEDYLRHREQYKEKTEKIEPAFNITVVYKLDGDSLVVDVPYDKILYRHAYPIVQLSVLPYFGAAGTKDEGFMLIPEGGGSVITFNNGKTKQNGYYADIYGWDYASDRKAVIAETRAAFPVFGESFGDSSFISIIEKGAEYAGVTAEISGKLASYNYVRADYKMIHGEQFEVSTRNTSAQYSYEMNLPEGEKISQIFKFVNSDSYVDMAKAYRDYLFKNEKKVSNETMPLGVEIVGAVDKVQQVAGMPKTLPYKLTSYSEAADIINEIDAIGIKNANIKLTGFINGGIRQKILKKFKAVKQLGGKSKFAKLIEATSNSSSKIYLDGVTQFAHRSGLADGFSKYGDSARFASDEVCKLQEFSSIWYGKRDDRDNYYLLRPAVINKTSDVLINNITKNNIYGVSFRDLGYQLSADYNDSRTISRAKVCEDQVATLKKAKDSGLGVMINAGNAYALKNADFITNVDLHGNSYAIIDYTVPFYQIALHGYKNFAGTPVNLGYENQQIILESAQSGAALYFVFMKESERILQETNFSEYYAACFDTWREKLHTIYTRYNNELGVIKNSCISDFEYVNDSVTATTFDNGYKVYVNFGYMDFVSDSGVTVPAREYKVVKGDK